MRFVTYERRGARRLGALVEAAVVDVPDVVGHPAYPTTMEALVARSGGTTVEAARAALDRPEIVAQCTVREPAILVPILPSPLRDLLAVGEVPEENGDRAGAGPAWIIDPPSGLPRFLGPGGEVRWPSSAADLDFEVELACVLGRHGRRLSEAEASAAVFGYTLAAGWSTPAGTAPGGESADRRYVAMSLGPCVVTADEFDARSASISVRVDGERWGGASLSGASFTFAELVSALSWRRDLYPGDLIGSGTFPGGSGRDAGRPLHPGAVVEVEAPGLGVLATRVARRAA